MSKNLVTSEQFCPKQMFRCDNNKGTNNCDSSTFWVCRNCLTFCLGENHAKEHLLDTKTCYKNSQNLSNLPTSPDIGIIQIKTDVNKKNTNKFGECTSINKGETTYRKMEIKPNSNGKEIIKIKAEYDIKEIQSEIKKEYTLSIKKEYVPDIKKEYIPDIKKEYIPVIKNEYNSIYLDKINDVLAYFCPTCGKPFSRRVVLEKHILTHDKETYDVEDSDDSIPKRRTKSNKKIKVKY